MPIFEYQCETCKKEFEKLVFASDDKDVTCPECGSKTVNKKMSAASLTGSSGCAPKGGGGFS